MTNEFMLGSCSNRPRTGINVSIVSANFSLILCNFAWQRIVNNVACVTRIEDVSHVALEAQYLVRLAGDAASSAYCKQRCICHDDKSWESFCVAGAVFVDLGGCDLLLRVW